jgi:hypothetical protein
VVCENIPTIIKDGCSVYAELNLVEKVKNDIKTATNIH